MTKALDNPLSPRETAPSAMRRDEPTVARAVGMIGLMMVSLGSVAIMVAATGRRSWVGPTYGAALLVLGLASMLFHAARDADLQYRRTYGVIGCLWILGALFLAFLPAQGEVGKLFLPYGVPCLMVGLLFLLPFIRNEEEERLRGLAITLLGLTGLVLAGTGLIGSLFSERFSLPYGLVLAVLGLPYLWSFVATQGAESERGYKTAMGFGIAGALVFLIALARSTLPPLFYTWHWTDTRPEPYFIPTGLLLVILGALYFFLAVGLVSDNRLVVMTRRELATFFYSPIAYIVIFCFSLVGWGLFYFFMLRLYAFSMRGRPYPEPMIAGYILDWIPVILQIGTIPVLTMRLVSEEHRTGSYEVLMTAPVSETLVVLSKFFGVFIFYMMLWLSWGFYLLALRVESGQEFEYRPLLSYVMALACMGAGFLSMGLFFSSLTRNQIVAAILSAAGMITFTSFWIGKALLGEGSESSVWGQVLTHVSYIDLLIKSVEGNLAPRLLLFHVSAAVFWLFLTVKVLESRKWR